MVRSGNGAVGDGMRFGTGGAVGGAVGGAFGGGVWNDHSDPPPPARARFARSM